METSGSIGSGKVLDLSPVLTYLYSTVPLTRFSYQTKVEDIDWFSLFLTSQFKTPKLDFTTSIDQGLLFKYYSLSVYTYFYLPFVVCINVNKVLIEFLV